MLIKSFSEERFSMIFDEFLELPAEIAALRSEKAGVAERFAKDPGTAAGLELININVELSDTYNRRTAESFRLAKLALSRH